MPHWQMDGWEQESEPSIRLVLAPIIFLLATKYSIGQLSLV